MTVAAMRYVLSRIAEAMGCEPESDDDLVEAVRLLVAERDRAQAATVNAALIHADLVRQRDEARAEVERLRALLDGYSTREG